MSDSARYTRTSSNSDSSSNRRSQSSTEQTDDSDSSRRSTRTTPATNVGTTCKAKPPSRPLTTQDKEPTAPKTESKTFRENLDEVLLLRDKLFRVQQDYEQIAAAL